MATSIAYISSADLEDDLLIASIENKIYNYSALEDHQIEALVDNELLSEEAQFYLNEVYQEDAGQDAGLSSFGFSDNFSFQPAVAALVAPAGLSRWSQIKAKAKKIACEIFRALGGDTSIKELIKKTLEKLKESILGGLPKLLVAIIVGILSFAAKKGFDWLCG